MTLNEISGRFLEIVPNRLQFYGDRPRDDTIYLLDYSGTVSYSTLVFNTTMFRHIQDLRTPRWMSPEENGRVL